MGDMPEPNTLTARVSQEVLAYREAFVQRTGIKKRFFDEQVYREYMKNHPLEDESGHPANEGSDHGQRA